MIASQLLDAPAWIDLLGLVVLVAGIVSVIAVYGRVEGLSKTVQVMSAANEELRATNDELRARNEELRVVIERQHRQHTEALAEAQAELAAATGRLAHEIVEAVRAAAKADGSRLWP